MEASGRCSWTAATSGSWPRGRRRSLRSAPSRTGPRWWPAPVACQSCPRPRRTVPASLRTDRRNAVSGDVCLLFRVVETFRFCTFYTLESFIKYEMLVCTIFQTTEMRIVHDWNLADRGFRRIHSPSAIRMSTVITRQMLRAFRPKNHRDSYYGKLRIKLCYSKN